MALLDLKSLERIADSLERLVTLYEADLASRHIILNPPTADSEGEVITTDDDETATLIDRLLTNRPVPFHDRGFRLPDDPREAQAWETPKEPAAPRWDDSPIFGGGWELNVGPEGAEENWGSSGGSRGVPTIPPRDVREQGNRPESEG